MSNILVCKNYLAYCIIVIVLVWCSQPFLILCDTAFTQCKVLQKIMNLHEQNRIQQKLCSMILNSCVDYSNNWYYTANVLINHYYRTIYMFVLMFNHLSVIKQVKHCRSVLTATRSEKMIQSIIDQKLALKIHTNRPEIVSYSNRKVSVCYVRTLRPGQLETVQ